MFPYPSGDGPARRSPARLHRHRRLRAVQAHDRVTTSCTRWATTRSGCRPSSTRCRPVSTRASRPRRTSRTCAASSRALGLGHDSRRSVATTDPGYYRWTQWIFLQLFDSWYDEDADRARPIAELIPVLEADPEAGWAELDVRARRELVDSYRLAYLDEAPVNWCPALGTVLANEEVTPDGRSERGNHPVYRRPLKQWMLRITAYADRLLADLDLLDWTDSIKLMQRNWIGRSEGAEVDFGVEGHEDTSSPCSRPGPTRCSVRPTWCWRPSTRSSTRSCRPSGPARRSARTSTTSRPSWRGIFGAEAGPAEAVRRYREFTAQKSELERQAEGKEKTGVFTGAFAMNPVNDQPHPDLRRRLRAHGLRHRRDHGRPGARRARLRVRGRVRAPDRRRDPAAAELVRRARDRSGTPAAEWPEAFIGDGVGVNSANDERLARRPRRRRSEARDHRRGSRRRSSATATVTYKLRDWLFSRQRYWGEPFPIVYDEDDLPVAVPESLLPVELPEIIDFEPEIVADDAESVPAPPLARAEALGHRGPRPPAARLGRRERGTEDVPPRAQHDAAVGRLVLVLPALPRSHERERVRLPDGRAVLDGARARAAWTSTSAASSTRSCTCSTRASGTRCCSTSATSRRPSRSSGSSTRATSTPTRSRDDRGFYVEATEVVERDGALLPRRRRGAARVREDGQEPEERGHARRHLPRLRRRHAAALRDVHGAARREPAVEHRRHHRRAPLPAAALAQRHRRGDRRAACHGRTAPTTRHAACCTARSRPSATDMDELSFNTAIARLFELNNRLTQVVAEAGEAPEEVVVPLVLMTAPLAPHVAEELWERLGHERFARLRGLSRSPIRMAHRRHRRDRGAGQRQGARPAHRARRRRRSRDRSRGPRRRARRGAARRQDRAQGRSSCPVGWSTSSSAESIRCAAAPLARPEAEAAFAHVPDASTA